MSRDEIISLFERHGALLFRGFDLPPEGVVSFTDRFTAQYKRDTDKRHSQLTRPVRFGQQHLANVSGGNGPIGLHSEGSHGVVWPEIVWFYCHVPSTTGGFTTLCDGVRFWRALSSPTRIAFLAKPVKYELELTLPRKIPGAAPAPWPFENPGVSGVIDKDAGLVRLSILRYAVTESRVAGKLSFANHLVHALNEYDHEIRRVRMVDDSPIDDAIHRELETVAGELTFDVDWKAGDLLMVDNRRFMHGRRAFESGDPRDILQIQSVRANFPFVSRAG